jgi:hypothetical protein
MRRNLALLLIAGALVALPLAAQRPRGAEIRVHNLPGTTYGFPQVAAAPNGDYVVVWQTGGFGTVQTLAHVWVRLFRADGTPKTKQFRVSTSPADEMLPRLAVGADGSFVVVWQGGPYEDASVFGRRFNADGTPRGPRFRLNSDRALSQYEPAVALAPDGSFVVAWTTDSFSYEDLVNVYARRFDAAGQPLGPDFRVNVRIEDEQESPQVAVSANGDFVIGWVSWAGEGEFFDIMVRRFARDGTPLTDELQANLGGYQGTSQVEFALGTAPGGAFVVLWTDPGAEDTDSPAGDDNTGILGQRFAASGEPVGRSFHVNGSPRGIQDEPAIAVAADGSFFAAWRSYASGSAPGPISILGRRFGSDNRPLGGEVPITLSAAGLNFLPAVALGRDGQGLVVWDHYNVGIFARRLVP